MRDPDLVSGAQLAAATLEGAWHRWRVLHGLVADPMPIVSSYVGYSLEEPWGEPRVVFGLAAEEAEQLAALLERHDCVGPIYAAVATLPGAPETAARAGGRGLEPLSVPRQVPWADAEQPQADRQPDDAVDAGEPLFRQAVAVMREAAAARQKVSRADQSGARADADQSAQRADETSRVHGRPTVPGTEPPEACVTVADGVCEAEGASVAGAGVAGAGVAIAAPADHQAPASQAPASQAAQAPALGSLARAASAARAEAEARIMAALSDYRDPGSRENPYPALEFDSADDPFAPGRPRPGIQATDELEPLPRPEVASGAYSPRADEEDELADFDESGRPSDSHIDGSASGAIRRGWASRSYPIPRLSRAKRPGVVP